MLNVNEEVFIKLTPRGDAKLAQEAAELRASFPRTTFSDGPAKDADGWSKMQLWQVMESFGSMMGLGSELPFWTQIRIPASALKDATP